MCCSKQSKSRFQLPFSTSLVKGSFLEEFRLLRFYASLQNVFLGQIQASVCLASMFSTKTSASLDFTFSQNLTFSCIASSFTSAPHRPDRPPPQTPNLTDKLTWTRIAVRKIHDRYRTESKTQHRFQHVPKLYNTIILSRATHLGITCTYRGLKWMQTYSKNILNSNFSWNTNMLHEVGHLYCATKNISPILWFDTVASQTYLLQVCSCAQSLRIQTPFPSASWELVRLESSISEASSGAIHSRKHALEDPTGWRYCTLESALSNWTTQTPRESPTRFPNNCNNGDAKYCCCSSTLILVLHMKTLLYLPKPQTFQNMAEANWIRKASHRVT